MTAALYGGSTLAQVPDGPCRQAIVALYPNDAELLATADSAADTDDDRCTDLADRIWNTLRAPGTPKKAPNTVAADKLDAASAKAHSADLVQAEDVAPIGNTSAGSQGSIGQVRAIAPIEPCQEAGGGASLSGTATGPKTVISMCANPAAVAVEQNPERFAKLSRFWDVSLTVPIDLMALGSGGRVVDSVSLQTRLDVSGLFTPVYEEMSAAYAEQLTTAVVATRDADRQTSERYAAVLKGSSNRTACARALSGGKSDAVAAACGVPRPDAASYDLARSMMRQKVAGMRALADSFHAGLDLRLDIGHSATAAPNQFDAGGFSGAGIVSYRLINSTAKVTLRGRLGGTYRYEPTVALRAALDTGVGADLGIVFNGRMLVASVGAVFTGDVAAATAVDRPAPRNARIDARFGVEVPLLAGGAVAVGFTYPVVLAGPAMSPVFTVSGDWMRLLGASPL